MAAPPEALQVAGRSAEEIGYHLSLLEQAGFIEAGGADTLGMRLGNGIAFRGLSWAGHDFLESVRRPEVWDWTKTAAAKVGGYTVDILVATAKAYAQQKFTELLHGQH